MPDEQSPTHNLPPDQYEALCAVRDCGVIRARGDALVHYDALWSIGLIELVKYEDGALDFRLTDAGRAAL